VDDRCDEPVDPDLRLDTTHIDIQIAAGRVIELPADRDLIHEPQP
jgi:hypothetical protein